MVKILKWCKVDSFLSTTEFKELQLIFSASFQLKFCDFQFHLLFYRVYKYLIKFRWLFSQSLFIFSYLELVFSLRWFLYFGNMPM